MLRILSSTKTRRYLSQISLIIVAVLFSIGLQTFAAGTFKEPTQSPPNGNAYAPLNTGPSNQTKIGEITSTLGGKPSQFRAVAGNYGFMIRNDGTDSYFLLTKSGDQKGTWNTLRPLAINDASGAVSIGTTLNVNKICLNGTCKTSWPTATAPAPAPLPSASTFSYTGSVQTYRVATGVNKVEIQVLGAQGKNAAANAGGKGGGAQGTLAVSSGEVLYVYVGGNSGYLGGWNGGGAGGYSYGGAGGGASDVRIGGTALGNRVIVAGGGGGASAAGGTGGDGGTPGKDGIGTAAVFYPGYYSGGGQNSPNWNQSGTIPGSDGGRGASGWSGGAGGYGPRGSGTSGTVGLGGTGAQSGYGLSQAYYGGGGGGGWYGGGGGGSGSNGGGGGGGGSDYIGGSMASIGMQTGVRSGNGLVIITPI